jgi:hypothetical protein
MDSENDVPGRMKLPSLKATCIQPSSSENNFKDERESSFLPSTKVSSTYQANYVAMTD